MRELLALSKSYTVVYTSVCNLHVIEVSYAIYNLHTYTVLIIYVLYVHWIHVYEYEYLGIRTYGYTRMHTVYYLTKF